MNEWLANAPIDHTSLHPSEVYKDVFGTSFLLYLGTGGVLRMSLSESKRTMTQASSYNINHETSLLESSGYTVFTNT